MNRGMDIPDELGFRIALLIIILGLIWIAISVLESRAFVLVRCPERRKTCLKTKSIAC